MSRDLDPGDTLDPFLDSILSLSHSVYGTRVSLTCYGGPSVHSPAGGLLVVVGCSLD